MVTDYTTDYMKILVGLLGRSAFSHDFIGEIVTAGGAGEKQVQAYNLCDGTRGQGEVAKAASLDAGNFSRTVARWIDAGIVFRLGEGRDAKLLHVYPLSHNLTRFNKAKGLT